MVEKVVQVNPPVSEDAPEAADESLFDGALRAAGIQLVRLSPLHTYTVPGLVTVLDLADPD